MFITKPRPKKSALTAPPPKKRKAVHSVEEISFDNDARSDYLTGFHKRKVQRQKQAQDIATEKARLERIAFRKDLREQRQRTVEDHVRQVNDALRAARLVGGEEVTDEEDEGEDGEEQDGEEWSGIEEEDNKPPEFVDHEEEYIDEDRFTTVTVEAVDVDRDGMHRLSKKHSAGRDSDESGNEEDDNASDGGNHGDKAGSNDGAKKPGDGTAVTKEQKKVWPKKKKKKFRYENKTERQTSKQKQKQKQSKRR